MTIPFDFNSRVNLDSTAICLILWIYPATLFFPLIIGLMFFGVSGNKCVTNPDTTP